MAEPRGSTEHVLPQVSFTVLFSVSQPPPHAQYDLLYISSKLQTFLCWGPLHKLPILLGDGYFAEFHHSSFHLHTAKVL